MSEATVLVGHVLDRLAELDAESVSCCVTSPPYWSLRRYDAPDVTWGGDAECEHEWTQAECSFEERDSKALDRSFSTPGKQNPRLDSEAFQRTTVQQATCARCGAWRGQLGLEPEPDCLAWARGEPPCSACYVCHIRTILAALSRVMRDDGCMFLNLGDGYCSKPVFLDTMKHARNMPSMWDGNAQGKQAGEGEVSPLLLEGLHPAMAGEARHSRAPGKTIEGEVSAQSGGESPQERSPESGAPSGGDSGLRREVRVLQRDGGGVPDSRPHKRRRKAASQAGQGQHGDDLSRSSEPGMAERQLSNPLLELQSSEGALGRLSTRPILKPKDLIGIPQRVQLAAQMDGWYVRSIIIWHKPNAMPESVKDRVTDAHEYVLMLTKKARYYFDQEAIREPHTRGHLQNHDAPNRDRGESRQFEKQGLHDFLNPAGRNARSVWTFPTAQTPEAHFATFPPELPRRCIEAACPREVCETCGHARTRVVETSRPTHKAGHDPTLETGRAGWNRERHGPARHRLKGRETELSARIAAALHGREREADDLWGRTRWEHWVRPDQGGVRVPPPDAMTILVEHFGLPPTVPAELVEAEATGWTDCGHDSYRPGVVLDCFAGLATTGVVARRLGRRFIGIELSERYAEMARAKLAQWWRPTTVEERGPPPDFQPPLWPPILSPPGPRPSFLDEASP